MTDVPPSVSAAPQEPHRGVLILVLGILSIVVCQLIGPFAWTLGKGDLRKMDAGLMDREGRGLTQAGYICGIIGTVLLLLWVVWVIFMFLVGGLAIFGAAAGAQP